MLLAGGGLDRSCAWLVFAGGGLALCWVAGGLPVVFELAVPLCGREVSVLFAALLDVPEPELAAPDDGAVLCVVCAELPVAGDCCGCDVVCCLSAADGAAVDGAVEFDWDGGL